MGPEPRRPPISGFFGVARNASCAIKVPLVNRPILGPKLGDLPFLGFLGVARSASLAIKVPL